MSDPRVREAIVNRLELEQEDTFQWDHDTWAGIVDLVLAAADAVDDVASSYPNPKIAEPRVWNTRLGPMPR